MRVLFPFLSMLFLLTPSLAAAPKGASDVIKATEMLTPSFHLNLVLTKTGGETTEMGSASNGLFADRETAAYVSGGFLREGRDGKPHCGIEAYGGEPGGLAQGTPSFPGPGVAWELAAQLVEVDNEVIRLRYRLSRQPSSANASMQAATFSDTVTLRHGQYRRLDQVDITPPEGLDCYFESLMVTVSTDVSGPAEYADEKVTYGVWVSLDEKEGQGTARHRTLDGDQGEAVDFDFEAWRVNLPELRRTESDKAYAYVNVSGEMRSWRIDDERSLVVVEARMVQGQRVTALNSSSSSSSGSGVKRFVVRRGETVKIVLPPPPHPTRVLVGGWDGPLPEGYERDGDDLLIPVDEELANEELALLVKTE